MSAVARSIRRLAILNRGEAAMRCLRAVKQLRAREGSDLRAIALYTDVDRDAPFVRHADEALLLPARSSAVASYLDHDLLLAALARAAADAVWPGWGFVAEDPRFADRLAAAGICFLGPSGETMRRLGDKISAKILAEEAEVPVAAWSGGEVADEDEALRSAARIGYPLLIKATAGGGGRGIRVVSSAAELPAAFRSAAQEARSAFGDGRLFLERQVVGGRHVEVQIAGDLHGRVVAFGCRDCSVQRRHQKVIEEAPPAGIPRERLEALESAAVRLAQKVGYSGVGTVEFLVTDTETCFLEVNPRLQVEHGITEAITGVDLVELQIRIARGERIPSEKPAERGFAIEARVCAEDPDAGFLPAPGAVARFDPPLGAGARVETGVVVGSRVPPDFDSLIAKVIVAAPTREEASAQLAAELRDFELVIAGGATNKGYLIEILEDPAYRRGGVDTGWLDRWSRERPARDELAVHALIVAAILSYQRARLDARRNFFAEAASASARVPPSIGQRVDLSYRGESYRLQVFAVGGWKYRVQLDGRTIGVRLQEEGRHGGRLWLGDRSFRVLYDAGEADLRVEVEGRPYRFGRRTAGQVTAGTPAVVVALQVKPGDVVEAGQVLGLLEAMKMEIAFTAPVAGTVKEVSVQKGAQVAAGDVLLIIDAASEERAAAESSKRLSAPEEPDPLDLFFSPRAGGGAVPDFFAADRADREARCAALAVVREEVRRVLLGYDTDPERGERLAAFLEAPLPRGLSEDFRRDLAEIRRELTVFVDVERLFVRTPQLAESGGPAPSNNARMRMFVRRIRAGGAGIAEEFLALLSRALRHYGIRDLGHCNPLERAVLRLFASQRSPLLRSRLILGIIRRVVALARSGLDLSRDTELAGSLSQVNRLRGLISDGLADAALEASYLLFEGWDLEGRAQAAMAPLDEEAARRIDLDRLRGFDLERLAAPEGTYAFHGRSREVRGDERVFVIAEVRSDAEATEAAAHVPAFERAFYEATRTLRSHLALRDPGRRLRWNRITFVALRAVALDPRLLETLGRRLAPATRHLGLEKIVIRLDLLPGGESSPRPIEIVFSDLTGSRLEIQWREPHREPLRPATDYERKVVEARRRGLVYPYEIVRMLTGRDRETGQSAITLSRKLPVGTFEEHDLDPASPRPRAVSVASRAPGGNQCAVVFGVLSTPTEKVPEGMRRVLVLSDPTRDMGALGAPECDRIVAAIDLAERLRLPIEWVPVSSGARIAMDSGTENLDATARVVRRIVTFTEAGGVIHVVVYGVNVGAQSYFDALATMGTHTRGVLIMTPQGSMVLTGRAALEASGAVSAEDELAIGGFERIMGPNGEAQYYAPDLAEAFWLLHEHYRHSYVVPGEHRPRPQPTSDPIDRDLTRHATRREVDHDFDDLGMIFRDETNPGRRRPFSMRALMAGVIDQDGGHLERWQSMVGADTAIVWDAHLGGTPVALVGIESRNVTREGYRPPDGPASWNGGTLFPLSSKKIARALNAASGNRPVVLLANLSGFDGSPESMRKLQLEYGAEIARAVVLFRGPIFFVVVSRYHGGAYVVFSRALNDELHASALTGAYASVIGGAPAAAVVFSREVRSRALASARVAALRRELEEQPTVERRERYESALAEATLEEQAKLAAEFDGVHTVGRALEVGSLERILSPAELRPFLIREITLALGDAGWSTRRRA